MLLVGPTEARLDDPPVGPKVLLEACRWERTLGDAEDTDGRGVIVLAAPPLTVAVDLGFEAGTKPIEMVVGGRAASSVATVRLALADRSVVTGVVSNGYWLAWWPGTPSSPLRTAWPKVTGTDGST